VIVIVVAPVAAVFNSEWMSSGAFVSEIPVWFYVVFHWSVICIKIELLYLLISNIRCQFHALLCAYSADNVWSVPQLPRNEPAPVAVLQHMMSAVSNMASAVTSAAEMLCARPMAPHTDTASHPSAGSVPASQFTHQWSDASHYQQQDASACTSVSGEIGSALYLSL